MDMSFIKEESKVKELKLKQAMSSLDEVEADSGIHKSHSSNLPNLIHDFKDNNFTDRLHRQDKSHDEDVLETQSNDKTEDNADIISNYTSIPSLVVNNAPDRQNQPKIRNDLEESEEEKEETLVSLKKLKKPK